MHRSGDDALYALKSRADDEHILILNYLTTHGIIDGPGHSSSLLYILEKSVGTQMDLVCVA